MTREQAIEALNEIFDDSEYRYVGWYEPAMNMAIEALKREQQLLDAGYQNTTVDFYIGGRLFRIKEIAQ